VEISQPAGVVETVDAELVPAVADVLGLPPDRLGPVQNAATSRVKTLVPVGDGASLDGLTPDLDRVEALCDRLGSTGLYPYAVADRAARVVDARQFPRSSGYPEDPATGIAAAALAYGLLAAGVVAADERPVTVRQGRAMGRPSEIRVRFEVRGGRATRCWLGGPVTLAR
jgi:PhzF family phenazine biosynthesis protein